METNSILHLTGHVITHACSDQSCHVLIKGVHDCSETTLGEQYD